MIKSNRHIKTQEYWEQTHPRIHTTADSIFFFKVEKNKIYTTYLLSM